MPSFTNFRYEGWPDKTNEERHAQHLKVDLQWTRGGGCLFFGAKATTVIRTAVRENGHAGLGTWFWEDNGAELVIEWRFDARRAFERHGRQLQASSAKERQEQKVVRAKSSNEVFATAIEIKVPRGNCPLCSWHTFRQGLNDDGHTIYQCTSCDHVWNEVTKETLHVGG